MAILYQHKLKNNNKIFYIGIGKTEKRAYSRHSRNKHWKNTVNKYGYDVEILYNNLTWEEACNLEISLIKQYGRRDLGLGTLVNLTDGGEGVLGLHNKVSDETKLKISNTLKGKIVSEITRQKLSLSAKGNTHCKNRIVSQETRDKISKSNIGKNKKGKKVLDTNTNIIYDSITIVATLFNIKNRTLAGYLDGSRRNKTSFIYLKDKI